MIRKLIFLCCVFTLNAQALERPNIIFIFADDWGWGDLSCHGHPYIKTPNIDRLAKEGTDFQRFTVASGVCSPSRTAVMTGQFPARHSINGHFAWPDQNAKRNMPDWLSPNTHLLPKILQDAGYATGHYGKWHLANNMIPDSPLADKYGYDDYGTFNSAGEQMPVHEDIDMANAFIEKSHKAGKPFFINLWMHETHSPFHTVPKYRWRFPDLNEKDNIYASVVSHADDRVGELLATLDRLELTSNTLVIFSSDNGPARGSADAPLKLMHDTATGAGYNVAAAKGVTGGRRGHKGHLFEGGIGVPFIARWPGKIAEGEIDTSSLMSAVDLLPTFCEIAQAELPDNYRGDGLSQISVLLGEAKAKRSKALFWKSSHYLAGKADPADTKPGYAVVDGQWKLFTNAAGIALELFDITKDVAEENNLLEQQEEVVKDLLAKLEAWKGSLPTSPDATCFSKHRTVK